MSVEAVGALDADLARANAASQQLAAALAQEHANADAKPGDLELARATVRTAEATLARAEAAVHADQAAHATAAVPHDLSHFVDVVA